MPFFATRRPTCSPQQHKTPLNRFALAATLILSFSNTALSAPKTEISASASGTFLKHENYDANGYTSNSESGWIPGAQIAITNTAKHLKSTFVIEAYNGDVSFEKIASNSLFTSKTSERLIRASYQLVYNRPRQIHQYYAKLILNDWQRNINGQEVNGLSRNYRWWGAEAGVQLKLYKNRYNLLRLDVGVSHTFLSKLLLDLTQTNMGKPLLALQNKFGGTVNIVYIRQFMRAHGIGIFVKADYWQFGSSNTRTIKNNAEKIDVKEDESQSLIGSVGMTYFYRF